MQRQVALGRKDWMFIGSLAAGQRTSAILSRICSAHRHYLDLHAYLSDVLERLARRAQAPPTNEDLGDLLPDRWKAEHPEAGLKFREVERRKVAEKKTERHENRRRAQRRSGVN